MRTKFAIICIMASKAAVCSAPADISNPEQGFLSFSVMQVERYQEHGMAAFEKPQEDWKECHVSGKYAFRCIIGFDTTVRFEINVERSSPNNNANLEVTPRYVQVSAAIRNYNCPSRDEIIRKLVAFTVHAPPPIPGAHHLQNNQVGRSEILLSKYLSTSKEPPPKTSLITFLQTTNSEPASCTMQIAIF